MDITNELDCDPYKVLNLAKDTDEKHVKNAYRKLALKYHPDKAVGTDTDASHQKFQEIAFAYALLADPVRRKRYDTTGNTKEGLEDGFDWKEWFSQMWDDVVTGDTVKQFKETYQGSEEEHEDLLKAYIEFNGSMNAIFENVMCSSILDDEERFRKVLDSAVAAKKVPALKAYTHETSKSRKSRQKRAQKEANEAEEMMQQIGVDKKVNDESDLAVIIKQRQANRMDALIDTLEDKYGKGKKTKKRKEPSEEQFSANRRKVQK